MVPSFAIGKRAWRVPGRRGRSRWLGEFVLKSALSAIEPSKSINSSLCTAATDKHTLNESNKPSCAATNLPEGVAQALYGTANSRSSRGRDFRESLGSLRLEVLCLLGGLGRGILCCLGGFSSRRLASATVPDGELGRLPEHGARR